MIKFIKKINIKTLSYVGLVSVMVVWGLSPIFSSILYENNSASISTFVISLIAAISLFVICIPNLKKFNITYLKIAIPTGLFNAVASLLQKIGLQYSTPTQYQFLENLSCVVVPILLFVMIKKKPNLLVIISSILCLLGAFILTGMINSGFSLGIGEILCALAGVLYGVNIAVTGVYAKKLIASIYVFIHMCVQIVVSLITAIALNNIIVDGKPLEAIQFSWKITDLLIILLSGVFFSAICWVIRTNVMKHVSATAVAIIMPFSAVVTGIVSVIMGKDPFTLNLVLGAIIGLVAAILSGIGDVKDDKKQNDIARTIKDQEQEE